MTGDPVPDSTTVEGVLADWREVQRRLEEVPAGTPEMWTLYAEAGRLTREYQSLVGQAVALFRASHPV
jgi:hypothetical protein